MIDTDLKEMFSAAVAQPDVDRIDTDAVLRGGRRRQRIRTAATVGSVAGVLVLAGSLVVNGTREPETFTRPAPPAATASATPQQQIATSPSDMVGRWEAVELDGQPVMAGEGLVEQRPILYFATLNGSDTTWSGAGVCNAFVGTFSINTQGDFRAQGQPGTFRACLQPDTYPGNPAAVLAARKAVISGTGIAATLTLLNAKGDALATYKRFDWTTDSTVLHAGPGDGTPSDAYLRSYVGMLAADAADRAEADGWKPQVRDPGDAVDLAFQQGRLRLFTDGTGVVREARPDGLGPDPNAATSDVITAKPGEVVDVDGTGLRLRVTADGFCEESAPGADVPLGPCRTAGDPNDPKNEGTSHGAWGKVQVLTGWAPVGTVSVTAATQDGTSAVGTLVRVKGSSWLAFFVVLPWTPGAVVDASNPPTSDIQSLSFTTADGRTVRAIGQTG